MPWNSVAHNIEGNTSSAGDGVGKREERGRGTDRERTRDERKVETRQTDCPRRGVTEEDRQE